METRYGRPMQFEIKSLAAELGLKIQHMTTYKSLGFVPYALHPDSVAKAEKFCERIRADGFVVEHKQPSQGTCGVIHIEARDTGSEVLETPTKRRGRSVARRNARAEKALEQEVADWNATVKIGDEVEYRSFPEAAPQIFRTRTAAEILNGHTAVVWLDGKSGCVCCDACRPVTAHA